MRLHAAQISFVLARFGGERSVSMDILAEAAVRLERVVSSTVVSDHMIATLLSM